MKCKIAILLLILFLFQWVYSEDEGAIHINRWLMLGPLSLNDNESMLQKTPADFLKFSFLSVERLTPETGKKVRWDASRIERWNEVTNLASLSKGKHLVYLAVYLKTYRWLQTTLTVNSGFPVAVYLDGQLKKTNTSSGKLTTELNLSNGKHLLLLKGYIPLSKAEQLSIKAVLKNKKNFEKDPISLSFNPQHRLNIKDLLNQILITKVLISPDGNHAAVFLRQRREDAKKNHSWVEILNVMNGSTRYTSENIGNIGKFQWMRSPLSFSFAKTHNNRTSIYVFNLGNFKQREILNNVKNFSDYWWSPKNDFLIYSVERKVDGTDNKGYKLVKKITDRTAFPKFKREMFLYYPDSGVTRKICAEKENFEDVRISPNGKKALLVRSDVDHKNRPFRKMMVTLFDTGSFKKEMLMESNWINRFMWSPDSRNLLLLGGPSAFKGLGRNLEEGVIPNDYDTQAYMFDLNSKKARPLTRDFHPSVSTAFWHPVNKNVYFRVTDRSFVRIYCYYPKSRIFKRLNTGIDVVSRVRFAQFKRNAVFWGSGVTTPQKLYKLNLSTNNAKLLKDYNRKAFSQVKLGKVKDWNFKTDKGKTIVGRVYYPPGFNQKKKYPCIVYYYGGTSPVVKDFGGRYPKNWYAANGYVVYVLQPSGTVGFGQEFSAVHVNDWGKVTSDEIVEGVRKFLAAHPFVDPKRVGAIGASYGGFMSQVLGTKTDIFAALISHAGISSLSSYWGIGDWGYTYSSVATANSFPWNRKDIYVGHSPLFMAERFNTPLLLLHGEMDNNVPPGESYQMFAALKLLGKEVALVTFKGQRHWILEYDKRIQWLKTIIAWFDKFLKKQPNHWHHMYGK